MKLRVLIVIFLLAQAPGCDNPKPGGSQRQLDPPVTPALAEGDWQAGVATGPMFAPFGVSMGGFGFRIGPPSVRSDKLGATVGKYQSMLVKAIAISNGNGLVILTKLPLIFVTDPLRRRVIERMGDATGLDFSDSLIMTATHTHSGPARFWAIPEGAGLFGMDEFDPAVLDGLAQSIADVAISAWEDLQPARVGATEALRFDPDNRISRDRRGNNDNLYTNVDDPNVYLDNGTYKSKDHRMWILRIDDTAGQPLAAVVRFGIHGIVFAQHMYSEDAPGNIERAVEAAWNVPTALFLQGNGGDVSPAGGDHGRRGTQQAEAVAVRTARAGQTAWSSITTSRSGVLAVAHRRRHLDRKTLGYADDEFGTGVGERFQPYQYGGFQCGEIIEANGVDDGNPDTRLKDGELGCIPIEQLQGVLNTDAPELPLRELSTAVMSAIRIGEWRLVTFPGEPVSQMGTAMREQARELGLEKFATLGYSQAHLFYLTPSEDWFQGGYEAAQNIWGWKVGEFVIQQNRELLARLDNYGTEPAWDGDELVAMPRELEARTETVRGSGTPGWASLAARTVSRFGQISGSWAGGDSWIDPAEPSLVSSSGQVIAGPGDWGWRVEGSPDPDDPHVYHVTFEPGVDTPLGTYRIRANGRAMVDGVVQEYQLQSPEFEIVAAANFSVTATAGPVAVEFFPAWRPNPITDDIVLEDAIERQQLTGLRMVTDSAGPDDPAPFWGGELAVTLTARPGNQAVSQSLPFADDCNCYALLFADLPSGTTRVDLAAGNASFDGDFNSGATQVKIPLFQIAQAVQPSNKNGPPIGGPF